MSSRRRLTSRCATACCGLLSRRAPLGARLPFDFFLSSLADAFGERAVCVILSGTGADGSVGLKAVSEKGGLVIAQDPDEAAYDGMPRSAIATGAVNLVLPAGQIPQALIRYARHPYVTAGLGAASADTLLRRARRRMPAAATEEIAAYISMLREDGRELEQLVEDFLIHVTSFFRDAAAFEGLVRTVMPDLVQHAEDKPIRVWVPGCRHRRGGIFPRHAVPRGVRSGENAP